MFSDKIVKLFGALVAFFVLVLSGYSVRAAELSDDVFASVDGADILWSEYEEEFRKEMRNRFYHGSVPAEEMDAFKQDVSDILIHEVLLAKEARVQGFEPDQLSVQDGLDAVDKSNSAHPQWAELKAFWLPRIKARLEYQSLSVQLEKKVKSIPDALPSEIFAYYQQHPEKFTQPTQNRLSLILLNVPPSSDTATWKQAEATLNDLLEQLAAGASFAELAEIHSYDDTADRGGDMGFVHLGMLGDSAQDEIDKLNIGEYTVPVRLLDGMAVFQLTDRKPESLEAFESVEPRAKDLLRREMIDLSWKSLLFRLRQGADIRINQKLLQSVQS
ncbi:MAG: peptidylprolyl isomerase [Motiliproteus sp.]